MSQVELSNKKLQEWPNLKPDTTEIRIENNLLFNIPDSIVKLTSLKKIMAGDNKILTISKKIGALTELTELYLNNNPIDYLPPSIEQCTKLTVLDLTGTKLPLPDNYNLLKVKENIKYILEHQKQKKPKLNIKKAFIFKNFSKPLLNSKFEKILEKYSTDIGVTFENIVDLQSINKSMTVVLIIIGFDVHEDQDRVFTLIEKCKVEKIPYKILFQKDIYNSEDIHIEKGSEIKKVRDIFEKNYKKDINLFNSNEEFKVLILSALQQHSLEVKLVKLELINIGPFENTTIHFDDQITCLIGENGHGKSSILRALALSIVGLNNIDFSLKYLLRIQSISTKGQIVYSKIGKIKLTYFIDSKQYCNEISLVSKDKGRIVDVKSCGNFEINSGEYHLKSLIVGFPQLRGQINQIDQPNKYSQPHVNDLIPLIKNSDDSRLDSFISWLANLYELAIQSDSPKETKEHAIIDYVFETISDLTGKKMAFSIVQQFSPPIIIVTSEDSPKGIPLNLISQGFKIIIGWIGYFIERQIEAFPLDSPEESSKEKSILIIDEIDSSIHAVWQANILPALRNKFPYIQIICTTHSPLVIANLEKNQVLEIKNVKGKMTVN